MSETGAITPAREGVRAAAGLNREPGLQEKKTKSAITAEKPDLPESRGQEQAQLEAIPQDQTTPRGEDGPSSVAPPSNLPSGAAEIELKLLVDPDRLADFNDAPIITTHARSKGARKHLKAVYYDTAERTLLRAGLTLRVRQSGARFTQTVKAESKDDPLRRGEWEASVPSIAPDLALAMPFLPEELRAELERHPLEAVFTTDIHRHQRIVELPSGTVEVAFDHGHLRAGDRSTAVSEIELELKGGSRSAIYDLALGLAEQGAVRPSTRSKSARGFELAADSPPTVRRPG